MDKKDKAEACFHKGFNCAQAVFYVFASELGLDEEIALKVAAGFGGGLGRSGETCGAVSGAMMALGLKYGQSSVDTPEKKQKTYELAQEFLTQFHARYGTTRCNDLTGTDITDPEAASKAKASGLYARICPGFIRDAVEIADKILTLSDGSH